MVVVRVAEPADAEAIARVQVLTWQAAYRGLIADSYLDAMSIEQRTERWQRNLAGGPFTTMVLVEDDRVIGFSGHGPSRDENAPASEGELLALYVIGSRWRQGLGRKLYRADEEALVAAGFTEAIVWALDGNARADRFYGAVGYALDGGTKQVRLADGVVIGEHRLRKSLG